MFGFIAAAALDTAAMLPPPPIITPPISATPVASTQRKFVTWHPGHARCNGVIHDPITIRRPFNQVIWGDGARLRPVTMQFEIDEDGRTLSIRQDDTEPGYRSTQISPALAASRFAPGRVRQNCTILYSPSVANFDEVPIAELASYAIARQSPRLPKAGYERLRAGDECRRMTQPLIRVVPDFQRITATPGVRDWALVGFDLTSAGETRNARILASTGNPELDSASVTAIFESRYNAGEARSGCSFPYVRNAGKLAAPAFPENSTSDFDDKCEGLAWAEGPRLVYPEAYRKRSIEGWAVLKYDVAPWGEIGDVTILDAQPTEDFGTAAKTMLQRAKKQAGTGLTDCVTRVRYEMAKDKLEGPAPEGEVES